MLEAMSRPGANQDDVAQCRMPIDQQVSVGAIFILADARLAEGASGQSLRDELDNPGLSDRLLALPTQVSLTAALALFTDESPPPSLESEVAKISPTPMLFVYGEKGQGGTEATVSCSGECLGRWPPYYVEGEPQAGDMADAAKLGTIDHDGNMMVTYNGWPLYYFVEDAGPGETKGHDIEEFGAEWYLVTPEGEKAED